MGIVLVLVLVWLVGWLRLREEGGRRKEVLRWWWCGVVWYSVVCSGVEGGVGAKENKM